MRMRRTVEVGENSVLVVAGVNKLLEIPLGDKRQSSRGDTKNRQSVIASRRALFLFFV